MERSCGRNDGIKSVEKGGSGRLALLPLNVPSLPPAHVLGGAQHVVAVPAGNGDESNSGRVVADLLDEVSDLLLDFLKSGLAVGRLSGVHLVDSKSVGEEGVLSGLSVLGNTSLELTSTRSNNQ